MLGGRKHEHVCINTEIFLGLPNPSPLTVACYEAKHALIVSKY